MAQIFGNFIQSFPLDHDSLELSFTPTSRPIKQRWRNNRLSAHFMADYFSTFLPIEESEPSSIQRIKDSKSAVSYIANELLENAVKFNDEKSKHRVKFGLHFLENQDLEEVTVAIFATNSIRSESVNKFQAFIQELLGADTNELYLRQIEKTAEDSSQGSGLGLLTMINDYAVKFGWKFETLVENSSVIIVTTMAQIII
jgi:hypothetical protein